MNLKQTAQLVKILQVAYPNMQILEPDYDHEIPGTIDFWHSALSSYEFADCQAALTYFKTHEPKRQFAPGLFEFEAEVRKVVSDRNAAQKRSQDVKRITHRKGDNPATTERYFRESGGQVREYVRISAAYKREIHADMRARGLVKETYALPNGAKGYRYTIDTSKQPSAARTVEEITTELTKKMSMPEPEAEDYSERYEWGSVWETMDRAAAMPMQDDTPIGPADFKRKREAL